jgi:uncharacterized cofD-like protein
VLGHAHPRVVEAIADADAVVLGPGSLYTSIIANLLVRGIVAALRRTRAPKIYVCNIMTQPGETTGCTAGDHRAALEKHGAADMLDYIVVNTGALPRGVLRRYAQRGSYPVRIDSPRLQGLKTARANMVSPEGYARHDPDRLAKIVMKIIARHTRGKR